MKLDNEVIEDIKSRVNIVDVISKYLNVIKKGNNYVAICPFHNDTNPSMQITVDKQIFKCFSCGAGGDVFGFVSAYERISFIEAVKKVASYINYDLSKYDLKNFTIEIDPRKEKLKEIVDETCKYYQYVLLNTDNEGIKYLQDRGINNEIIRQFKIGYSPLDSSKILRYLTKKGYSVNDIVDAGIGIDKEGFIDRFNDRVVFPITNINGDVVAFSGRRINEDKPNKYVNSNENILFNKSECLYNLFEAKTYILQTKKVYVVEGFMDAIALYKAGIYNVIATMGVNLSKTHIKELEKFKANVILCLDNDEPGQAAMIKIVNELKNSKLRVNVVNYSSEGKDLDEIFNEYGKEGVIKYINDIVSVNEFKFNYKFMHTNFDNYLEKSELIKYASIIANEEIKDRIEKENFISWCASKIGCNRELISENTSKFKKKIEKSLKDIDKNNSNRYYKAEIEIIKQMLYSKDAVYYYINNLGFLLDSDNRSIATYIVDYYYKQLEWDGKKIVDSIEEERIKEKARKIYDDNTIAKLFDKNVFLVLINDRPLEEKIKELENKFKEEQDYRKKAVIVKELANVKQLLKGNKSYIKEDN